MALNIKVSSSDWIDLRTRGYASGMYLLNAVGAAIEYSTAAMPVPGTTLVGSSAVLISGTYLWVRGSGDCELYTASEWAAANVKTVPVMASTSSSGGIAGLTVGSKTYDKPLFVDSRPRIGATFNVGSVLSNLLPDGTVNTPGVAGTGTYKYVTLTLPDGRRRPAYKLTAAYGTGNQGYVEITLPTPRVFLPSDVISLDFYTDGKGVQPNVYLFASSISHAYRFNSVLGVGGVSYVAHKGLVTINIPFGMMAATGTAAVTDVMTKLRVSMWNTAVANNTFYFLGAYLNRTARPAVCFSTDDGFLSNAWYADQLAAIGAKLTANIITSRLSGSAGYMTTADLKNLYARGNVMIGNHSHSHIYVNGNTSGVLYGSTMNGICLAQTLAAGVLTLNGAVATANSGVFDKPRHVCFSNTATVYGCTIDIAGKLDGVSISETVTLGIGGDYPRPSELVYDKVDSLTVNANGVTLSGTIQVGTSMSYDEIYYDVLKGFNVLSDAGVLTGLHYCEPQGNRNNTLDRVLKDLGVLTSRGTEQSPITLVGEVNWHQMPAMIFDLNTYGQQTANINFAVNGGSAIIPYTHDIVDAGASGAQTNKADVLTGLSTAASLIASGALDALTIDELYKRTAAVGVA